MPNDLSSTPRLEPSSVSPLKLQGAVDAFNYARIEGIQFDGYDVEVVGVDISPGIVMRLPDDRFEAAAKIYLDLKAGRSRSSSTVRATVEFHLDEDQVAIDKIVAARRAA
jgi:hypothetical protein